MARGFFFGLYDSAGLDGKAYLPTGVFEKIMKDEGLNYFDVRDCFDGAVHLVTSAIGIDNSTGIRKKMKRLYKTIKSFMLPIEIERRFLLARPPDFSNKALRDSVKISIEQDYIKSPGESNVRIRVRRQDDWSAYYLTKKSKIPGSKISRHEIEEVIDEDRFRRLKELISPDLKTIYKNRYHFLYKFQHFDIELLYAKEKIFRPPFLDIEKEVTGDPKYSNYGITRGL